MYGSEAGENILCCAEFKRLDSWVNSNIYLLINVFWYTGSIEIIHFTICVIAQCRTCH